MGRVSSMVMFYAHILSVNWDSHSYFFWYIPIGAVFELGSEEYKERLPADRRKPGSRAVIDVKIHRVSTVSSQQPYLSIKSEGIL